MLSNLQMKRVKHLTIVEFKKLRFSDVDKQAIDSLRDEQADGQRTILSDRSLKKFKDYDETTSHRILDIIADGLEEGTTFEKLAETIQNTYSENYKNQAYTIARTEVLTATSQGIKWNHDVLGQVFTKVEKQWYHVGDAGVNPDAREHHAGFEQEGKKPSGYMYGGVLEYPRDPGAPADETINCRCSLVSTIPDDATSNAEAILENL
jgi:hypothetical protein